MIKKVRRIEIKTRGLSQNIFAGEYHTAFKGRGMTFSEVREYQYGDDVRSIDWNVTARFNRPYVKVFEEERELTLILLIDISGSRNFGTRVMQKKDLIAEVAATLAFSSLQNNDKVGVIMFSDRIEKFIPPQKGRKHVLHIIRELLDFEPKSKRTDISMALQYFTNAIKKRSTAFIISDFLCDGFDKDLMIANRKHDIAALEISDPREMTMPDVGLVKFKDAETGERLWIDTGDKAVRSQYEKQQAQHREKVHDLFAKSGVDYVNMSTDGDYVKALMKLFKMR